MIEPYKGKYKNIYCVDKNGYYLYCSIASLIKNIKYDSSKFDFQNNKYIKNNIQTYFDKHNLGLTLLKIHKNNLITIKCKCGTVYKTKFYYIQQGMATSCKKCIKRKNSKMENFVSNYLKELCVDFEPQKQFDDCKDKRFLPFDFYLSKYNCCIECQGEQHYKPIDYFGGLENFIYVVNHDIIKRDYCLKNNIKLIKICYLDFDDKGDNKKIINILNSIINK